MITRDATSEVTSMATDIPVYISVRDMKARYGTPKSSVYRDIAAGRYKAVKDGARTKIITATAEAYYNALPLLQLQRAA
jgi:hypothetical protein